MRVIPFTACAASGGDAKALAQTIPVMFGDVLQLGQDFFEDKKSEEWGVLL